MRLSELQTKKLISVLSGKNIGSIIDIEVDSSGNIENLIINSSKESDVVLDCFMGTGTTGVACKKLNRMFVGIEINTEYFNNATKRIKETNEKEENNNDTN